MTQRIALVGMPNTGKSTLFNRLTGAGARVGNWPGLTVELLSARLLLGAHMVELVDLPGLHNLHGFSEDERVARHFVETQPLNGILVVLNTTQLERQLALVLQLKSLGLPMLLALNMADEARNRGIRVRTETLAAELGMPVHLISAKHGQGVVELKQGITDWLRRHPQPGQARVGSLAEDDVIEHTLDQLIGQSVHIPVCLSPTRTDRLDRLLLHPWLGIPLFLLLMLLVFQVVYGLGAPLQDGLGWLLDQARTRWLSPLLAGLPAWAVSFLVEGLYDGVGTVLSFLPIIIVFFLAMAVVEDSGYLARAAFLMDRLLVGTGLDGRAFVMQLMGFGCNVPAILGTRVMRDRGLRLLSMLVIPFSLCSARLNVFLFMAAVFFPPRIGGLVIFGLYLMSFAAAMLTALLFRGRFPSNEPLVLELPPYRLPTAGQMLSRAWSEVKHFWLWSRRFIIFGVVAVWLLNNLPVGVEPASSASLAGQLGTLTQPLLAPIGINPKLAVALLFGFIAKEIVLGGLAVIYGQADPAALSSAIAADVSWPQAVSFMLFTLLYTPCLSTVAVIRSESKKLSFTLLSVGWSLLLAWLVSFVAFQAITRLA